MRRFVIGLIAASFLLACQGKPAVGGGDGGNDDADNSGFDGGGTVRDGGGTDGGGGSDGGGGGRDSGTGDAGGVRDAGSSDGGFVGNDVVQHHANPNRDGVYTDPYLTTGTVATMHVDTGFNATTGTGPTYAQPLYLANGVGGAPTLFVATENNDVYALDANTGAQQWTVNLGTPVPLTEMSCGNINPAGVTGTPVIDTASRTIFLAAMVSTGGTTPHHMVFARSVDDGSAVWSLDVGATIGATFTTKVQGERGALLFMNGTVYVPYGGLDGDCGNYHGWVVAIPSAAPTTATAWSTNLTTSGSGIWGPSGIASDGTSIFVATGNSTSKPTVWLNADSEAVVKLTAASPPVFTALAPDYFAPSGTSGDEWHLDDNSDSDVGSSGVVLFDAPGATPSHLGFVIGKGLHAYLVDRDDLGGIDGGLQSPTGTLFTTSADVMGAMFAYTTAASTYVGFRQHVNQGCASGDVSVLKVSAAAPPQLSFGWCANTGGNGSPIVSQSASQQDVIVWTYGSAGDEILRAYDGDTGGTPLFTSGALHASTKWNTPMIAGGRVYVAGNGVVTALTVH